MLTASVIINNYNYGRYLAQAIESALSQDYPCTEVIVVDDGSTDESREIIAGYGERITAVLKENGGQASALNAGFRASEGQIILFLDSDDVLLPDALSSAAQCFNDAEVVKVHWALDVIDRNGTRTPTTYWGDLPEGDLREVVLRVGPFAYGWSPMSGNVWARRFLEPIFPIPEEVYKNSVDLYLVALAPLYGRIKKLPKACSLYRIHGENSRDREGFDDYLRVRVWRADQCLETLAEHCRAMSLPVDISLWKANSFWHRLDRAIRDIETVVPPGGSFILVDQEGLGMPAHIAGRRCIPFTEREGQYWGAPPDDAAAIRELERLQRLGAGAIAFAWPAFWWLDYYSEFQRYLRTNFHCVLENERLVVFDLTPDEPPTPDQERTDRWTSS